MIARQLSEESNFKFHWPSGNAETYKKCIRYNIIDPPASCQGGEIYLAFGWRDAYGAERRRILVFRSQQTVLAEFVGVDNWDSTHNVAWAIKAPESNSGINSPPDIPDEFREFTTARLDSWIMGPYARRGFAVRLHEDNHEALIKVALFREKHKTYQPSGSSPRPTRKAKEIHFLAADSRHVETASRVERMWHIAEKWRASNHIYHSPVQGRRYRILKVTDRNIQVERMDGGQNALLRMATVKRLVPTIGARHLRDDNLSVAGKTTLKALWLATSLKPVKSIEQGHTSPSREPESPSRVQDHHLAKDRGGKISVTHGGRSKGFSWRLVGNNIHIKSAESIEHSYSVLEIYTVLHWLKDEFGTDWFPLANNVELLGGGKEKAGLGMAILEHSPDDISHAQGASYLGVVLEEIGLLAWNGEKRGIQWRLVRMPESIKQLKQIIKDQ